MTEREQLGISTAHGCSRQERMAAPAKSAWLLVMLATLVCGLLNKMHLFFGCAGDLGVILLVLYMLPFYPSDTFGEACVGA